jgi:hypothetical protein
MNSGSESVGVLGVEAVTVSLYVGAVKSRAAIFDLVFVWHRSLLCREAALFAPRGAAVSSNSEGVRLSRYSVSRITTVAVGHPTRTARSRSHPNLCL